MTMMGRIVSLFPTLMIILNLWALGVFAAAPNVLTALLLVFTLYLFAPILFRIHDLFRPLNEGVSRLDGPIYSPWWASHQFQLFYDSLPFLESLLRLVPGAYSAWLRLWGARVGFGVHWTPRVEIVDRPLMLVGNRVVFGHKVEAYAHLIRMRGSEMRLLVKRIHIGDRAFIGAGSRIGPGGRIPKDAMVPTLTDIQVNHTFGGEVRHGSPEEAQIATDVPAA
jgi:hypothetical protein